MTPLGRRAAMAALFAATLTAAAPGHAEDGPVLDAALQARLMALEPIGGRAVDRALFDGRPVLVLFFASW